MEVMAEIRALSPGFQVMSDVNREQVVDVLRQVADPDKGSDIVSSGMASAIQVKDGHVQVTLEVDPARGAAAEPVRKAAEDAVAALPGVLSATAVLTAERKPAPARPRAAGPGGGGGDSAPLLPDVKAIVAVASGKGGVGKSTTAANLAIACAANGLKTGLLDADIYGPSMPRMMGLRGQKPQSKNNEVLLPLNNYGVTVMSIGFLIEEDTPMIWRGPMVMSALQQMMRDVAWGPLDILILDMPPGTGDAQLTVAQRVPLAGAVIVSTPQEIALLDARKGLNMFRKVDVPVLGIIENMSYFVSPSGERAEIFGHGGARKLAEELHAEFLGEMPLDMDIRETSDGGHPIVAAQPDSEVSKTYRKMAARVWEQCEAIVAGRAASAPKIVMD